MSPMSSEAIGQYASEALHYRTEPKLRHSMSVLIHLSLHETEKHKTEKGGERR